MRTSRNVSSYFFSVRIRRHAVFLLEKFRKVALWCEACVHGDLGDRKRSVMKKFFRILQTYVVQKFYRRYACLLSEKYREICIADVYLIRNFFLSVSCSVECDFIYDIAFLLWMKNPNTAVQTRYRKPWYPPYICWTAGDIHRCCLRGCSV